MWCAEVMVSLKPDKNIDIMILYFAGFIVVLGIFLWIGIAVLN